MMLPFLASQVIQIHPQLKKVSLSPKGSCTPKMLLILGGIKDRICLQSGKRWYILEICNYVLP